MTNNKHMNLFEKHSDEAVSLYVGQEWSTREIGTHFGVDKSTVSDWLKKKGVEIRRSGRGNTARDAEKKAGEDLSYLWSPEAIAKKSATIKGRPQPQLNTPEAIEKRKKTYTSEQRSETLKKLWQDPEYRANLSQKRSEQATQRWAEGNWRNSTRVSSIEYLIAPELELQGFIHNINATYTVSRDKKTRIPDFIDPQNMEIVEVWGDYWHQGEDPNELVQWYESAGYSCRVIWEHELTQAINA